MSESPIKLSAEELKEAKQHLAHTEVAHDASAPVLEPGEGRGGWRGVPEQFRPRGACSRAPAATATLPAGRG